MSNGDAQRSLEPAGRGMSQTPFGYRGNVLGTLRDDQVPRLLGAITDPTALPTRTVQLSGLTAIQNRVQTSKVKAMQGADLTDAKKPLVFRHNGMDFIGDGHHRLAAAWLSGNDTAEVHFKDLQPVTQAVKGMRKDGPSASDVHVDAPMGGGKGSDRKLPPQASFDDTEIDDLREEQLNAKVIKVDTQLGVVFGWAIVCKVAGQDYYDLNIDLEGQHAGERVPEHVTEPAMAKAAVEFGSTARPGNEMHDGPDSGTYVCHFPMTTEIFKEMFTLPDGTPPAIEAPRTGMMVCYKPTPAVLQKFKDGTYKGFSIEGSRVKATEH